MHGYTSALKVDTLTWVIVFPLDATKVLKVQQFGRGYAVQRSPDLILSLQIQCGVPETLLLDGPLLSEAGCEH